MKKTVAVGQVVESTTGRDSGKFFLVRFLDGDFCLIVDGRVHKSLHPKRKRLKHLRPVEAVAESIRDKWLKGSKVFDSEISSALKQYNCKSKGEANV